MTLVGGVYLTLASWFISYATCASVTAILPIGSMIGTTMVSRLGRNIASFRGIPYAKPPIGDLRFMAPLYPDPWVGVLNATIDAAACLQKNYLLETWPIIGSEDCLYLNVYTPTMDSNAGLDVMVYIHGGGWFTGTGASYLIGPQYFMDKDIVLVTVNYRLGPFGFLSTGDSNALGNYAMKDLVMSLEWVRDNIASFGGNPGSVTIFGQSVGAANVHFLMLSPMARGLFHKAISQSGNALSAWALMADPLPVARTHGAAVGCVLNGTDTASLVSCLRGVDGYRLVDATDSVHFWSIDPPTVYHPVIEHTGDHPFISKDPFDIIRSGEFSKVPWLTGVVVDAEGSIRAVPILTNETLVKDLNANLDLLMPPLMNLPLSVVNCSVDAVWQQIKKFYFTLPRGSPSVIGSKELISLYGDRYFYYGLQNAVTYHVSTGHTNIYVYSFEYRGMYSGLSFYSNTTKDYGVCHCDELLYVFYCPLLFPPFPKGHPDIKIIETLTTIWTNFAKHGHPTLLPQPEIQHGKRHMDRCLQLECSHLNTLNLTLSNLNSTEVNSFCTGNISEIQWPPVCPGKPIPYLTIGKATDSSPEFCLKTNLLEKRMFFWNSLPLRENQYACQSNSHSKFM